ncbi:hypothetical protein CVD28_25240 [Bacillus sp. M6-12]|uniref:WG repeat-containing protein n=1 Tax=Bacillus sp. M6-12 TaxID=2054166 RepID=UPI000C78F883|nr:WG repeat-containing protein [Bacillus sp. M6-12]PLS14832.1 hypothetical protein CVD28_25240 [Bacillus sp. M6-12]
MKNLTGRAHLFPASVKTAAGTKWGFINDRGQFVLPPQYENAGEFQKNGLAIVQSAGRSGLIDQTGHFVVKPQYSSISPFSEERAVVLENGQGFKVIDETGNVLTDKAYSFISSYKEQRAVFQESIEDKILYGYLDLSGKVAIPAQYQSANDFTGGKALVKFKDPLYALISLIGEQQQTFPYEQMGGLSEGLISFKKTYQDKAGYVNESGEIVIPPQFTFALPFQDGRAVVNISEDYSNQYGLIDKTGSFVIQPKYNDINLLGGNRIAAGIAIVQDKPYLGSVFAISDTVTGQFLTDFVYDSVNDFQGDYSSVTKGLKTFFINKSGKPATGFPILSGIGMLSLEGNLIKAFVDQRLSYYDRYGRIVWKQNTIIPLSQKFQIREEKYRPNKDYLVYYPQIEGMKDLSAQEKVNQVLKNESQVKPIPENVQLDYSYTGDFSVTLFQKSLLVLELNGYHYPFGAAHGMPSKINISIDLNTGKIYQLKDLFKSGTDYVKVLSEIIEKKIQEQPDFYFFPDAYKGIQPYQPFYVTKDALAIYFLPYEIAAFAAGFPTFEIPFGEIMKIVDTAGDFWRSFH